MSHIFDERFCIDDEARGNIIYSEHLVRYELAKGFVSGKRVLDVASGSGYGSKILAEAGGQVVGVDISSEAVESARVNYSHQNIEYKIGSVENLESGDGEFDVVVSFETIEHLKKQDKYLSELARVVKRDGLVLISTPNIDVFGQENPFHFREYNEKDFRSELSEHFAHVHIMKQGNAMVSAIEVSDLNISKESRVDVVDKIMPLYFVAVCSHSDLAGRLPVQNIYSTNYTALNNLYNNPGFKLVNKIYSVVVKIPGIGKILKSLK